MTPTIHVTCEGTPESGWSCRVDVAGGARSTHDVGVSPADLTRLAPAGTTPEALVEASFAFLLEREPPQAILRSFDLPVIGRYFPEYEVEIRNRV